MKRFLLATAITAITASVPTMAANVGVSVTVGQPGFFGRVDIGDAPAPVLIRRDPVIIQRPAVAVVEPPIYLHVPPREARDWRRNCSKYDACGRKVYFVDDRWYNNVYVPHHRDHFHDHDRPPEPPRNGPPGHDHDRDPDRDHDRGSDRDHDRDPRR